MRAATFHNGESRSHVDHVSGTSQEMHKEKRFFNSCSIYLQTMEFESIAGVATDLCPIATD